MTSSIGYGLRDFSPLWTYEGAWGMETDDDGMIGHVSTLGARASFEFNATDIMLTGSVGFNHASFAVILDGVTDQVLEGTESKWFSTFFSRKDLGPGPHHLTIVDRRTDAKQPPLRFARAQLGFGSITATSTGRYPMAWLPTANLTFEGTWRQVPGATEANSQPEIQMLTEAMDATATIRFHGDGIVPDGFTGKDEGSYSVQLDGGREQLFNATKPYGMMSDALYIAQQLPLGDHTLVVRKSTSDPNHLSLLRASVYDWEGGFSTEQWGVASSTGATSYPAASGSSSSWPTYASGSGGLSKGAIGGIVGGAVAALILLSTLFLVLRKRAKTRRAQRTKDTITIIDDAQSEITVAGSVVNKKVKDMAEIRV